MVRCILFGLDSNRQNAQYAVKYRHHGFITYLHINKCEVVSGRDARVTHSSVLEKTCDLLLVHGVFKVCKTPVPTAC